MKTEFRLFDTTIGRCAIAWGEKGIVGVWLPESADRRMLTRIRRRLPEAVEGEPAAEVRAAIDSLTALLAGERRDLSGISLDLSSVTSFPRRVYEIARTIPPGETRTYGEIAAKLGNPSLAREVGQALARNPFPLVVPCHRVLAANGKSGGFSAPGGVATKLRLLQIEGARSPAIPTLF
jgi:methylated-DNA-[protein]-cysteine S-methyltransferase